MLLRDRMSSGSGAGLQAWIVSSLFHAVLLALCLPLFQHLPQMSPEPFRLTISLVEPFDPPLEGRSTPPAGEKPLRAAPPSTSHRITPPRPSATVSLKSEVGPQRATPVPESHAVTVPQLSATGLQQAFPLAEMARDSEPPGPLAESVRPQEIAAEQPIRQAGEPTLYPTPRSLDQPGRAAAPLSSHTPSDAVAPPALPVTQNEGAPPPLVASRTPTDDHGSSLTAGESGPIQKEEVRSAQARPPVDYGWLQQALFRRLEELKRSSRPSIEESGLLRVLVKAVVSSTGDLMEAEIANSSGHYRIDQEAMRLVQRAFPMSLDRDLERPQIIMRIPITFSRD
ncbi:MAG: TonB family protein [Nitrospiraceae bacterium]